MRCATWGCSSFAATLGVLTAAKWHARCGRGHAIQSGRRPQPWQKPASCCCARSLQHFLPLPVQLAGGLTPSGVSVLASSLALPLMGPTLVCGAAGRAVRACAGAGFCGEGILAGRRTSGKAAQRSGYASGGAALARLRLPRAMRFWFWHWPCCSGWPPAACAKCGGWPRCFPCTLALAVLCYTGLMRGTVRVALVGSASTPCIVAVEDGRALVAFQGGSANAQKVQEYLEEQGIGQIACLVDLRRRPGELTLAAQCTVTAQELPQNTAAEARVCDIMGTVFRMKAAIC